MENADYHKRQYAKTYRSTEVFVNWLEEHRFLRSGENLKILDMACGAGANTVYMANRFKDSQFIGLDIDEEYINYGNQNMTQYLRQNNCKLYKGDWFNPEDKWINTFGGVISF